MSKIRIGCNEIDLGNTQLINSREAVTMFKFKKRYIRFLTILRRIEHWSKIGKRRKKILGYRHHI